MIITDGILLIDKPGSYTSFDVVARARGMLHTKKIGHAGTLDPMATGVLPLFIGRATKCCDILPCQDKRYLATFKLGIATDTQDITGSVTATHEVTVGKADVQNALNNFRGAIQQMPPMYSAVQVDGKRLYDLARQGIEIERKKRDITIYSIDLVEADEQQHSYTIDVHCSKGTYIRTICHDLGQLLGCGATLTQLRRTMAAGFNLEDCIPLEEANRLSKVNMLWDKLIPVENAFKSLPQIIINSKQTAMFKNGVRLDIKRVEIPKQLSNRYRVLTVEGDFLGIAHIDNEQELLICDKLFMMEENKK
ncbi:MAG: tRNA pseudouridine(55) synthase TruB [Oscillospiraceae bacterium]